MIQQIWMKLTIVKSTFIVEYIFTHNWNSCIDLKIWWFGELVVLYE